MKFFYCFRSCLIKPDFTDAHSNLGNVLTELGKFDEVVTNFARAQRLWQKSFPEQPLQLLGEPASSPSWRLSLQIST